LNDNVGRVVAIDGVFPNYDVATNIAFAKVLVVRVFAADMGVEGTTTSAVELLPPASLNTAINYFAGIVAVVSDGAASRILLVGAKADATCGTDFVAAGAGGATTCFNRGGVAIYEWDGVVYQPTVVFKGRGGASNLGTSLDARLVGTEVWAAVGAPFDRDAVTTGRVATAYAAGAANVGAGYMLVKRAGVWNMDVYAKPPHAFDLAPWNMGSTFAGNGAAITRVPTIGATPAHMRAFFIASNTNTLRGGVNPPAFELSGTANAGIVGVAGYV
jgi:hypothetical protein